MSVFIRDIDGTYWRRDVFTHAHVTDRGVLARFTDPSGDYIEAEFTPADWAEPRDLAADAARRAK